MYEFIYNGLRSNVEINERNVKIIVKVVLTIPIWNTIAERSLTNVNNVSY
jgi:hypothetical protein